MMMSLLEPVDKIDSFGSRLPGSDGDRRTSDYIAAELERAGREVELDDLRVRSDHDIVQALHALLAVIGTIVSTKVAPLGVVILLVSAVSMYLDLTGRMHILRAVLPRRKTRNVTSPGTLENARVRVVVTAHHDVGRSGLFYSRFAGRLPGRLGRLAGPLDLVFWLIASALVLAAIRVSAGGSGLLTILQLIVAVLLLVAILALLDAAFAKPSPGASSNAAGVAAALELARRLKRDPTANVDVCLAFPAASSGLMLGMREWLRSRKSQLQRRPNVFINIDMVGSGRVHWARAEGYINLYWHDQHLVDLSEQIVEDGFDAGPTVLRFGTDGFLPTVKGHPSITLCCLDERERIPHLHSQHDTPENVDERAVGEVTDFTEQLIRRLDAEIEPPLKSKPRRRRKPKTKKPAGKKTTKQQTTTKKRTSKARPATKKPKPLSQSDD